MAKRRPTGYNNTNYGEHWNCTVQHQHLHWCFGNLTWTLYQTDVGPIAAKLDTFWHCSAINYKYTPRILRGVARWPNGYGVGLAFNTYAGSSTCRCAVECNPGQVVYTRAIVVKQYISWNQPVGLLLFLLLHLLS